jgi:hypothetical protein
MSPQERELRSRLAQLIGSLGLVRGTLTVREKSCGKPTCHCARGEKHRAPYLSASEEGKLRQLFIPLELEDKARGWVENYQRIRQLLEELSQLHWDKLKRREP